MVELAGFKDVDNYVSTQAPPPEAFAPPPVEPQPDPAMIVAEAEIEKTRADNELKRQKMFMDDDFNRDKFEADVLMRAAELQAKYGAQVNIAELRATLERDKEEIRQAAKYGTM